MIFTAFLTVFMVLLMVATLYPILNTLAVSFNDGLDTVRGGIYLKPRVFTLANYVSIFKKGNMLTAFTVSVSRTVIMAVLDVFCTAMVAYTLTRKNYIFKGFITMVYVLTMYFNAGLIPGYMLNKQLHLLNTFAVYILPGLVSAFNLIVVRTFMKTIPESLVESAAIDGAGDFRTFWSVMLPLSAPVLATIALFSAVGAWNSWFDTFLYNGSSKNLTTLQYEMMKLLSATMNQSSTNASAMAAKGEGASGLQTPVSTRAAITIVAAVPILCVYPFLQKYFVQGMTLGSVKE
ncbi:MAG: carbohydrate ABC transporter permease [Candidatus Ornithomonoglobus sp.]